MGDWKGMPDTRCALHREHKWDARFLVNLAEAMEKASLSGPNGGQYTPECGGAPWHSRRRSPAFPLRSLEFPLFHLATGHFEGGMCTNGCCHRNPRPVSRTER